MTGNMATALENREPHSIRLPAAEKGTSTVERLFPKHATSRSGVFADKLPSARNPQTCIARRLPQVSLEEASNAPHILERRLRE